MLIREPKRGVQISGPIDCFCIPSRVDNGSIIYSDAV